MLEGGVKVADGLVRLAPLAVDYAPVNVGGGIFAFLDLLFGGPQGGVAAVWSLGLLPEVQDVLPVSGAWDGPVAVEPRPVFDLAVEVRAALDQKLIAGVDNLLLGNVSLA